MIGSFDFDKPLKQTRKVAEELLALLSNSIAQESINSNENHANEQESSAVHQQLSHLRLAKARRAYQKAKHAITEDEYEEAIEHSRRGLMHVDLARKHFNSNKTELSQLTAPTPQFAEGSCEESIQTLIEAITQIKLVAEYKKVAFNRRLQERLLDVVQSLQDAIESYGQPGSSSKRATKLAEWGQVWAQFIYGHLTNDELYPRTHPSKSLRSLTNFAWQITTKYSSLTASAQLKQTHQVRAQMHSLEKSLESALEAYVEDNTNELEKHLRLGNIEFQALKQYEVNTECSVQVCTDYQAPINFNLIAAESNSLREDLARMASLLNKHHPDATRAETALKQLRQTLSQLKRTLKEEEWPQASLLLDMCKSNTAQLKIETAKLDI